MKVYRNIELSLKHRVHKKRDRETRGREGEREIEIENVFEIGTSFLKG